MSPISCFRRTLLLALMLFAAFGARGQAKKETLKPAEIQVVEVKAIREEQGVLIDALVRNIGEKPVDRLHVIYELLDTGGAVLTRQKADEHPGAFEPGSEVELHVQMHRHARAHSVRLEFEDVQRREIRAKNAGPYAIE